MKRLYLPLLLAAGLAGFAAQANAAEGAKLETQKWSWQGIFGTYDRAAQQRGFQVYKEVCAACHSMNLVAYRHLGQVGFSPEQIKAIAAEKTVKDGPNDQGDMFERPGRASDRFVAPFANDNAARAANGGALPPDLSLMNKARVGGPDYVYSLLVGYQDAPSGTAVPPGMYYNKVFPGHLLAMAPPLSEGSVTYSDGTATTVPQMARDVVTFLNWAAEPELEERKQSGIKTMLFLIVLTGMLYALKRQIWRKVAH
jgi:ubiquinol-cytochrome c reductase cytochrome c1 subunit